MEQNYMLPIDDGTDGLGVLRAALPVLVVVTYCVVGIGLFLLVFSQMWSSPRSADMRLLAATTASTALVFAMCMGAGYLVSKPPVVWALALTWPFLAFAGLCLLGVITGNSGGEALQIWFMIGLFEVAAGTVGGTLGKRIRLGRSRNGASGQPQP